MSYSLEIQDCSGDNMAHRGFPVAPVGRVQGVRGPKDNRKNERKDSLLFGRKHLYNMQLLLLVVMLVWPFKATPTKRNIKNDHSVEALVTILNSNNVQEFKRLISGIHNVSAIEALLCDVIASPSLEVFPGGATEFLGRSCNFSDAFTSTLLERSLENHWFDSSVYILNHPDSYSTLPGETAFAALSEPDYWIGKRMDEFVYSREKLLSSLSGSQCFKILQRLAVSEHGETFGALLETNATGDRLDLDGWIKLRAITLDTESRAKIAMYSHLVQFAIRRGSSWQQLDWVVLVTEAVAFRREGAVHFLLRDEQVARRLPETFAVSLFVKELYLWTGGCFDTFLTNPVLLDRLTSQNLLSVQGSLQRMLKSPDSATKAERARLEYYTSIKIQRIVWIIQTTADQFPVSKSYWESTLLDAIEVRNYEVVELLLLSNLSKASISRHGYTIAMELYVKEVFDRTRRCYLLLDLLTHPQMWPITKDTLSFINWFELLRVSIAISAQSPESLEAMKKDPSQYSVLFRESTRSAFGAHLKEDAPVQREPIFLESF